MNSLYILDISLLLDTCFTIIFFHSGRRGIFFSSLSMNYLLTNQILKNQNLPISQLWKYFLQHLEQGKVKFDLYGILRDYIFLY